MDELILDKILIAKKHFDKYTLYYNEISILR